MAAEFQQQVLPHLDAAYNLARWLVRDPATADDVVQEAMLRAFRFHAGLRGDPKPWLLQIVRNAAYAALDARRTNAARAAGLDEIDELADLSDTPEAAFERSQDRDDLDRLLAALPAPLRECLVLRELEALSYKEIAAVTGVAIGTVMSRLWRARQLLANAATEHATR